MNERRTFSADLAAEVRRVAKLARIYVSEDDVAQWTRDLGRILEYVRQLNELNVEGVEPTAHAIPVANVLRCDDPAPGLSREEALSNAPAARDGLFIVPKIIE
jgi:aspartyl-tRNA(Asn)/glutamyl-tRNA(Gln) amidotransferase subunit C